MPCRDGGLRAARQGIANQRNKLFCKNENIIHRNRLLVSLLSWAMELETWGGPKGSKGSVIS